MALRITVRIEGGDEVIRALEKLPNDAQEVLRGEAKDIATSLADRIKIAGRRHSRQAARAASTVKEGREGFWPTITASNTGRARGFLFGSEFGMNRRTGWYAKRRYFGSRGYQFGPHLGGGSYWFFREADRNQAWVESQWRDAADQVIRRWSA